MKTHLTGQELKASVQSVDAKVAMGFRASLVQAGTNRKTAQSYLSALRSRWQHWIDGGVTDSNPWRDVRMPKARKGQEAPRRDWGQDELARLFEGAASPALFDLMSLLLLTGCRRDEVSTHADLLDGFLVIRAVKTGTAVRRVPVAECLRAEIGAVVARIKGLKKSGNS